MKLITKSIITKLLQARQTSMIPIVKFFNPSGSQTWLICSAEETETGDIILQGYCDLGMECVEFGSVFLSELESVKLSSGLKIERDLYWKPSKDVDYEESLNKSSLFGY